MIRLVQTQTATPSGLEEPQESRLGLADLSAIGWTAAAAVQWGYRGVTAAQCAALEGIWDFAGESIETWTGLAPPFSEFAAFLAGPAGKPTGFVVEALRGFGYPTIWQVEFRLAGWPCPDGIPEPERRSLLPWSVGMGLVPGYGEGYVEFLVHSQLGSNWPTIRVHPRTRPPDDFTNWSSFPWHLKMAGRARAAERQRFQAADAQSDPIAQIDPQWEPRLLAETVMAQLLDWHYRVLKASGYTANNIPPPTADAITWWEDWVQRTARNNEVGFLEALTVAQRSVRPAHPAAHRKYWRESLRPRKRTRIDAACALVSISKSTAHERLRKQGRRADEFDSPQELAAYLHSQTPSRQLPSERRAIIAVLLEHGMKPAAARRFEYRVRQLPPADQKQRLLRKLQALDAVDTE